MVHSVRHGGKTGRSQELRRTKEGVPFLAGEPWMGPGAKPPKTWKTCWTFDWMTQILYCSEIKIVSPCLLFCQWVEEEVIWFRVAVSVCVCSAVRVKCSGTACSIRVGRRQSGAIHGRDCVAPAKRSRCVHASRRPPTQLVTQQTPCCPRCRCVWRHASSSCSSSIGRRSRIQ